MRLTAIALVVLLPLTAWCNAALDVELDHAQHRRATALFEQLRCVVCQNQSVAESGAQLAQDLRRQVREQIVLGRTDTQIKAFMVERYGDFVLYRPPLKAATVLLWFGPPLLLVIGGLVLMAALHSRRALAGAPALNDEQRRRAALLLGPRRANGASMSTGDDAAKNRR